MDPQTPLTPQQPYTPPEPVEQAVPVDPVVATPGTPADNLINDHTIQSTTPMLSDQPNDPNSTVGSTVPLPPAPTPSVPGSSDTNMLPAIQPLSNGNERLELIEHLKKANHVLVTVSSNPSVDQLSAAIGLTLVLNKLDKHATAVYSGETPSAIEFLNPDKTIEKNTDSLQDFIIALDKAKADRLRYKVEDKFVKIFITPYHTSINEKDLEFSQGDFNVDVVIALGVQKREELDQAIVAHGRILHDAVTVSVNNSKKSDIGAINWYQPDASSLCEMVVGLIEPLQGESVILDSQSATSFLTGVVAETERFSNTKTTPLTMNVSALLMKAGANQQLISSKLEEPIPLPVVHIAESKKLDELAKEPLSTSPSVVPTPSKDGSLEIKHQQTQATSIKTLQDLEKENQNGYGGSEMADDNLAKIHINEEGKLLQADQIPAPNPEPTKPSNMIMTPPSMGENISNSETEEVVSEVDSVVNSTEIAEHTKTINPLSENEKAQTLEQIEQSVHSPHLEEQTGSTDTVNASTSQNLAEEVARNNVQQATSSAAPDTLTPIQAPSVQPSEAINDTQVTPQQETATGKSSGQVPEEQEQFAPIHALNSVPPEAINDTQVTPQQETATGETNEQVFPPQLVSPDTGVPPDPTVGQSNPSAPPLVPPPLMPPPTD